MTTDDVIAFAAALRVVCPDYAGIHVTHLGNFRVRIECVSPDRLQVSLNVNLDEERGMTLWARDVATHLNKPVFA